MPIPRDDEACLEAEVIRFVDIYGR